jgi:hypothetical protein
MTINLNKYSFGEWVKFVFDHPVADDVQKAWYWDDEWEWEGDPTRVLEYSIRLFRDPEFLPNQYTPEQINQGFWFLLGATNQLQDWIWDENIDWRIRRECIMSMVDVFGRLFAKNPAEDSCSMWWDLLRSFEDSPDPKVKEAMLESLSQILRIDSLDCQVGALHGLGHLEHDGKRKVIEEYLGSHPNLDAETKEYALAAIEGRVL